MMLYSIFFILSISVKLGFCWPTYYYYDRNNTNGVFLVNGSVLSISTFDWTRKTNIIIHGFNDAFNSWYCTDIKNRLLELENSNVIIVDWSAGAAGPLSRYPVAAANVKVVGKKVATFMLDNYLYPSLTYCIGYSLGAHGCGFLGKQILGLARITGLDPAGPLFALQSSSNRLAPTDATIVDCIHTSLLGVQLPICSKNFYPNGGINQPGCPTITDGGVCNHRKAVTYYIESMSDSEEYYFASKICYEVNGFFNGTCKCDPVFGCSRMGYYANLNNQTGRFFLNTYTNAACSGQTGSNSIRNIILFFAFFTLIFSCFYICFICICLGFIRRRRDRKQSKSQCQLESELQLQSQTQCQLELQPQLEVLEIQSQLECESQAQGQLQSQSELELESQPSN